MMGPLPLLNENTGLAIAHIIELKTLLVCNDGSNNTESNKEGHDWVLATAEQETQGAGPDDCHPLSMFSCHSEQGSLISVLWTIFHICLHQKDSTGKVKYHCALTKIAKIK
jgi:hypothetical protein